MYHLLQAPSERIMLYSYFRPPPPDQNSSNGGYHNWQFYHVSSSHKSCWGREVCNDSGATLSFPDLVQCQCRLTSWRLHLSGAADECLPKQTLVPRVQPHFISPLSIAGRQEERKGILSKSMLCMCFSSILHGGNEKICLLS